MFALSALYQSGIVFEKIFQLYIFDYKLRELRHLEWWQRKLLITKGLNCADENRRLGTVYFRDVNVPILDRWKLERCAFPKENNYFQIYFQYNRRPDHHDARYFVCVHFNFVLKSNLKYLMINIDCIS